jgi:hypothetical protein
MEDASAEFINATPAPLAEAPAAPPAHQLLASNVAALVARLRAEYRPRSLTEELYVREIARHAAALETVERAEPALLRTAASAVGPLAGNMTDVSRDDLLLSTAITTEPLERVARYRRGHERGLHLAVDKLRACQAATYHNGATGEIPPPHLRPGTRLPRLSVCTSDSESASVPEVPRISLALARHAQTV